MNRRNLLSLALLQTFMFVGIAIVPSETLARDSANEVPLDSKVTAVTLYRTQAMVTRTIELDGDAGAKELVVSDLPENIVPGSLFAEGDDGVEVRAVRFRSRAVSDSPREEVRVLEKEIGSIQEKMLLNGKQQELLKKNSKYLDKLDSYAPPTANFDLGRGVLDAKAVEQLTQFSFSQRQQIMEAEVKLSAEQRELDKQLNLAQRKIREITNGSTRTERQAVLFAQKTAAGKQSIRLNYLTNACGWSPTYTVRAESEADSIRLEYNGLIQQMSGEDWDGVKLTLSTASPALSAAGPGLAPFRITLSARAQPNQQAAMGMGGMGGGMYGGMAGKGIAANVQSLQRAQSEAIKGNRIAINSVDNLKTAWTINNVVNNFDCLAISSDTNGAAVNFSQSSEGGEEPALSYQIESLVSLPSRNNQQMVRVLAADLDSDLYHIATPVLTSYVYREAELNNNSKEDLLAGPLAVYLDGRFVGRSEIPTVARGQTFVVGLGADSQLRSRRELADKSNLINGGNRETKVEYTLIIENYKETPAKIRIVDRMPIVEDDSNVRVTLASETKAAISEDGVYVRTQFPKGILRWDTEVAGRAIGESAHEIDYAYTLEYDRNYVVSLPENLQEQESEYNEMESRRRKR